MRLNPLKSYFETRRDLKVLGEPSDDDGKKIKLELQSSLNKTHGAILVALISILAYQIADIAIPHTENNTSRKKKKTNKPRAQAGMVVNEKDGGAFLNSTYDPKMRASFVEAFQEGLHTKNEADSKVQFFTMCRDVLPSSLSSSGIYPNAAIPLYIPRDSETHAPIMRLPNNSDIWGKTSIISYYDIEMPDITVEVDGKKYDREQIKRHVVAEVNAAGIKEWVKTYTIDLIITYAREADGNPLVYNYSLMSIMEANGAHNQQDN